NKISEAIASKTSRFFGHAVAAVVSVVTFIPSLAVDLAYAAKSLYDRKITKLQTPAPNLPVIPEAKVQWPRYIHDDDVKATMENYDRFLADNLKDHPDDIPEEAYDHLYEDSYGNIPIELITQEGVKTVKLKRQVADGVTMSFHDIGDGQVLARNGASHQFYDELMMHRYLEKLGIPANEIKPAVIRWEFEGTQYTAATYIGPSSKAYAEQNAILLEIRSTDITVTRLRGRKLLPVDTDQFNVENWDEVLTPLVNDIRTLIDNGVSTLGDPLKVILVGKGNKFHSGGPADYEARAFPFDFSSKRFQYDQLPVKKRLSAKEEEETLRAYIQEVVNVQFNYSANLPQKWEALVDKLTRRYRRRWHFL
ncbi:hypothetical protein, partial [Endozoicomonas sp. YOMI1]|uniref:hypothetical protein n=1 Tax=Endozoicomonas sp. YOMI1 TaxID=2828739 RepID=UPI002149184E